MLPCPWALDLEPLSLITVFKGQILNLILLHVVRVQEIPVSASDDDLARNDDLVVHLVPALLSENCKIEKSHVDSDDDCLTWIVIIHTQLSLENTN